MKKRSRHPSSSDGAHLQEEAGQGQLLPSVGRDKHVWSSGDPLGCPGHRHAWFKWCVEKQLQPGNGTVTRGSDPSGMTV